MMPTSPPVPAEAAITAPESIRRRYVATLATRLTQLAVSFLTAGLVPRALGPTVYGNYNFLLNTAATLRGLLEPSAYRAFFTFSSQDERTGPLTKLYGLWVLTQFGLTLILIAVVTGMGFAERLWPGQRLGQIILVTAMDWVIFIGVVLQQLSDSKGLTVRAQLMGGVASLVSGAVLLVFIGAGWLNFYSYAILNLVFAFGLCVALVGWLLRRHAALCWDGSLRGRVREYLRRWWRYASPLILLEYYTPLIAFANTYLVQVWYGSVEQGYLGLALRWSALVLVFTSSVINIFWRELAHANAAGDRTRAAHLYFRFNHLLFFLALALSFWLSLAGRVLVPLVAGREFEGAVPVLMIMAFYPVAQTFGQLTTTAMQAVERTAPYRNLRLLQSVPELPLSYFLLASPTARVPGLGLGAVGVAIQMVAYGLLSVQLYEWSNCRFFGLNYGRSLLHKLGTLAAVSGVAGLTLWGLNTALQTVITVSPLFAIAIASAAYFGGVAALVLLSPDLAGIGRSEIQAVWEGVGRMLRTKRGE